MENMIKCACGETGFRKEQSSLIETGRRQVKWVKIPVGSRYRGACVVLLT